MYHTMYHDTSFMIYITKLYHVAWALLAGTTLKARFHVMYMNCPEA